MRFTLERRLYSNYILSAGIKRFLPIAVAETALIRPNTLSFRTTVLLAIPDMHNRKARRKKRKLISTESLDAASLDLAVVRRALAARNQFYKEKSQSNTNSCFGTKINGIDGFQDLIIEATATVVDLAPDGRGIAFLNSKSNDKTLEKVATDTNDCPTASDVPNMDERTADVSATGESIVNGMPILIPCATVGDTAAVKINISRQRFEDIISADLVNIITGSTERDNSLIKCKYFGKCSGCQYQMVPYERQLELKSDIITQAFDALFSTENENNTVRIPKDIKVTPSPLQYGYRTKITPHFDRPKRDVDGNYKPLPIGFHEWNSTRTLDIEECVIATAALNKALKPIRERVLSTIASFKNGSTLLLRESLKDSCADLKHEVSETQTEITESQQLQEKVCVSNHKQDITERVGEYVLKAPAGTFFQNNNSIIPALVSFVKDSLTGKDDEKSQVTSPRYMVDAYCGSGLFSITCSSMFERVIGVEISHDSVTYATSNATLNRITNTKFVTGSAEKIFDGLGDITGSESAVVVDPPRKGCGADFIKQLVDFRPARIVYVSCNVFSQARDIAMFFRDAEAAGAMYQLEQIRGFDLFPQTRHVESVAVISRIQT